MATNWTSEQILGLAPDTSAAKAARELGQPRKWVRWGQNPSGVWGECQGSARLPYQTAVDPAGPAFHCTCPSRKQPCKHALGLFLVAAANPAEVTAPPDWMAGWLAGRAKRAEARVARVAAGPAPVDTTAQARRAASREARVAAGLDDLDRWLQDLTSRGLATAQSQPAGFWHAPAQRLVDAQAPGVARLVRDLPAAAASGEGWQERLLERLGRLALLVEGFRHVDALPPATQADVRTAIGWAPSQDDVLATPGLRDTWLVWGRRVVEEDRLRVERTWLWGQTLARPALVLQFAPPGQPFETLFVPGTSLDASLAFYPGAAPLRALLQARHGPPVPSGAVAGYATIAAAVDAYGVALAACPWLELWPMPLTAVIPFQDDGRWWVCDAAEQALPLSPQFADGWRLRALSGGRPLAVCGEWDGDSFLPLSACADRRFVLLGAERG